MLSIGQLGRGFFGGLEYLSMLDLNTGSLKRSIPSRKVGYVEHAQRKKC